MEFLFIFINIGIIFLIFVQKKAIRSSSFSEKFSQETTNFNFLEIGTTFLLILALFLLAFNFLEKN